MKKNHSVRPYRQGDEEEIVQLLELVFDGWPHFDIECSPLEHWRWKFEDNPIKSSIISVGTRNGEIIGCSHRISRKLKIGESVILCCTGADQAVHPNFRKMGLFKKMDGLGKELERKSGIHFFYGISGNPILIKYRSKDHHTFPHATAKFVRIQDIDWHLQMMHTTHINLYKYGYRLVKLFNKFKNALSLSPPLNGDFRIKKISSFDNSINAFWNEIKDHYTFIVERTKDYLNWRCCDPRGGNYLIKIAERDGHVLGCIVLRINKYQKDYPTGYIIDLLTLPGRLDIVDALIRDAIQDFDNQNINIIKCQIIKNQQYERIFKKYGFLSTRNGTNILWRSDTTIGEELSKFQTSSVNRIHFVYGDYDDI